MNFSSLIGFVIGTAVVGASLHESGMDMGFFLNFHGLVIVCGGTLAATSVSYPLSKIFALLKVFFLRVLGRNKVDYRNAIEQFLELSKKMTMGLSSISESVPTLKHEFMKEAVGLVAAGVLNEKEIRNVLEQRIKTTERRYLDEANIFRVMGRFSPAFGLLATTLGMIALLQQLGKPGAENLIGPAMSIGLVGTLYGIALANLVFIPIAENLTERTKEEIALRKMILEGALLLKTQVNPVSMREGLNSFLLPRERIVKRVA